MLNIVDFHFLKELNPTFDEVMTIVKEWEDDFEAKQYSNYVFEPIEFNLADKL